MFVAKRNAAIVLRELRRFSEAGPILVELELRFRLGVGRVPACSDMAVMAETASLLVYQAAWLRDTGRPYKREAAMAKLYATESAVTATRMATQVFGGYGFMDETPVARQYRDAKVLEIGEGTSEIQRVVIARDLGLPMA